MESPGATLQGHHEEVPLELHHYGIDGVQGSLIVADAVSGCVAWKASKGKGQRNGG